MLMACRPLHLSSPDNSAMRNPDLPHLRTRCKLKQSDVRTRYHPEVGVLITEAIFKQRRPIVQDALPNLSECEWLIVYQGCIARAGRSDLVLDIVKLCRQVLQFRFQCGNGLFG